MNDPDDAPPKSAKRGRLTEQQIQDAERLKRIFDAYMRARSQAGEPESQAAFAARARIGSQSLLWQYLNGRIPLNIVAASKFAHAMNVNVDDFSPTIGAELPKLVGKLEQISKDLESGELVSSDFPFPFETLSIRRLDVIVAAGAGTAMPEFDEVIAGIQVSRSWAERELPQVSALGKLAVISAYGDSMLPTFANGDLLLVDTGVSDVKVDAVYVLRKDNMLYVKRLQRRNNGNFLMISDNKFYESEAITPADKAHFSVLGRVVWIWNGKRT
jgi:phage repressor protein C with HTH and peptisase S24 domain